MSGEPFVVVDVDDGLERILRSLQKLPDQLAAPQVLQKSLNATARKARTRLIKEAGKRYALSKPEALKNESKVEASTSDTSSAIISKGSMRDIMDFLTQPNSDTAAAAAQVLNSGSMSPLESNGMKAFVARFASGHVAIVQRQANKRYTSAGASTRAEKYGSGVDMTKIKKLLSPAVPQMLGNAEGVEAAQALVIELLNKELDKQIEKALE